MASPRLRQILAAAVAGAVLLSACGGGEPGDDATPAYRLDQTLRLNQIQVRGTHNSYHVAPAAGPNLTPETFRDGLFNLPPTEEAITNPRLSFGDHGIWPYTDYNGVDDATEIWWDPDEQGPDEIDRDGTGMWRYVDGGKRYLYGEWTEDESKVFQEEGSVAILEDPPEDEQPPDYPSPAENR